MSLTIPNVWTFDSEEVAKAFDSHVREQLPWYETATSLTVDVIRNYIYGGCTIYDFGASTGNFAQALPQYDVISVDNSSAMCDMMNSKGIKCINANMQDVDIEPFDVAICFLSLMFIPIPDRAYFIERLREQRKDGGVIIIVDKFLPHDAYLQKVFSRLTLKAKISTTDPKEVLDKELSLIGVQRPLDKALLGNATPFFAIGEFAGYIL